MYYNKLLSSHWPQLASHLYKFMTCKRLDVYFGFFVAFCSMTKSIVQYTFFFNILFYLYTIYIVQ